MSDLERIKIPAGTLVQINGMPFRIGKQCVVDGRPESVAALKATNPSVARANDSDRRGSES